MLARRALRAGALIAPTGGAVVDPNELLQTLLELSAVGQRRKLDEKEVDKLTAGLAALDDWLLRGGYWPERWVGRGVNLKLADAHARMQSQVERISQLFVAGQATVLPAAQPRLVIGVPLEPDQDGRVVAALATYAAFAADPARALEELHDQLAEALARNTKKAEA